MRLGEILDSFKGLRALVVGDLMLDEYIFGRATRISPEAPVMVVRQQRTSSVPGGAANVAKNLVALGATTHVVGVIGDDAAGRTLRDSLVEAGITQAQLVTDASRPTTRKTRVLADSAHQVLRIDHEDHSPSSPEIEALIVERVRSLVSEVDVVLLSDYQKGAVTKRAVEQILEMCRLAGVTTIANAKPQSIGHYRGANLVSLNLKEASEATGWPELREQVELGGSDKSELPRKAAAKLGSDHGIEHVLVTLGEFGMCTADFWIPPRKVEVFDTAGAGDTTIATLALGMKSVGYRPEVFTLAAQASAAVCRRVGVAVPTGEDLAEIYAEGG